MAVSRGNPGVGHGPRKPFPPDPLEMGERHFPPFGEIEPSEWVKGLKKGSRKPQSLKKIGVGIELTDEAVLSSYGDPAGQSTKQIGTSIASKVDNDILDVAKTAKLQVKAPMNLDLIDQVSAQLIDNDSDFNYEQDDTQTGVLFLHPKDANALRKLASNNWTRTSELGDNILVKGAFGELFGWTIVRTRKVATGYGLAVLPGAMKTYIKRDTNVETFRDIDHKTTKINADKIYGVAIVNDAKIVRITPATDAGGTGK